MTCASCSGRVEKVLRKVPGVLHAEVNLATEHATVLGVDGVLRPADLIAAVQRAGYGARLLTGDAAQDRAAAEEDAAIRRREGRRVFAALVLCAPLILPMAGLSLPGWVAFALATPVQFYFGGRFYVGAWKALRAGTGNMDLLVALGSSAAYFYSLYLLADGSGRPLYFEGAAVVIAL
ncbi:MAG: cation-translocating P-type ATPase, partial [Gammaproteobacteria bacterium]|nr:cation-translocating P-type ATPase [Gammaproteobacteria bacterium]